MLSLFRNANAGLNLSPIERAVLRFVEGAIAATLVSMLPALSAALNSQSPDWGTVLHTALATFAVVVLLSFSKWAKAHGDAPLAAVADTVEQQVQPSAAPVDPSKVPDFPPGIPLASLTAQLAPVSEPAPVAASS